MPFLTGSDRNQAAIIALDDMVEPDAEARVIDAFVDALDLGAMGFGRSESADTGRPAYSPACLLKLYMYGYRNGIRSSRKLARACRVNVEVMWLTGSLEPDFRTIADFRKDNAAALPEVLAEFTRRVTAGLELGFQSVDGTKVRASNSKDRNFTLSKLDDRIDRLEARSAGYLSMLDEADADDAAAESGLPTREQLESMLAEALERLARYEGYRSMMEREGLSQLSLTDPDSKLMRTRSGFDVAYNAQAAVDSETHLITSAVVTDRPTDHGLIAPTIGEMARRGEVTEVTADKGYVDTADMAACLESGILPSVILPDGAGFHEVEFDYEPDGSADPSSTAPAQLAACLRSGTVPDAYAGTVEFAEVVSRFPCEGAPAAPSPYASVEQMAERAAGGYFVRDPERNLVVCPAGNVMRPKSIRRNGSVRYANKLACKDCGHKGRCIAKGRKEGAWKEVDFPKDRLESPCRGWNPDAPPTRAERRGRHAVKRALFRLYPKPEQTRQRKCLSEHPFGTIKRMMGADHFLLRGLEKANAEFSLMALSYNLARSRSLLGFEGLMEAVRG